MNLSGNTILITGGSTGIGLALAERLLKSGNTVIICGRREEKLQEARRLHPELHVQVCDVAMESERLALFEWIQSEFPGLNVLVNNAGIQHRMNLMESGKDWSHYQQEIAINLEAPIHLAMLFIPHLAKQKGAAIVNISSGLAFTPMAAAPIYSATKAAIHSFTTSLRYQLSAAGIEVIEVAPPAVNTDLAGKELHAFGVPLDEFTDGVYQGLKDGRQEIGYGTSEKALRLSRDEIDETVKQINNHISF